MVLPKLEPVSDNDDDDDDVYVNKRQGASQKRGCGHCKTTCVRGRLQTHALLTVQLPTLTKSPHKQAKPSETVGQSFLCRWQAANTLGTGC
jgi:hypothetical protein